MSATAFAARASTRDEAAKRAREGLATVGLAGYDERQPSELSGGQQQRVAVARALVLKPSVLLFDEPLSNLDARLRRQMREEIRELQQRLGLTVVYVTHDQQEAMAVSDRIIVMNAGRIEQQGSPRELYERPATPFLARFMGESHPAHGSVRRVGAGHVRVRLGESEIEVANMTAVDGEASIAVRPEAITVETPPGPDGALPGRITKASYLGTHMEYSIDTAAGMLFATCPRVRAAAGGGREGGAGPGTSWCYHRRPLTFWATHGCCRATIAPPASSGISRGRWSFRTSRRCTDSSPHASRDKEKPRAGAELKLKPG